MNIYFKLKSFAHKNSFEYDIWEKVTFILIIVFADFSNETAIIF